jgi:hypothetical protein
MGTLCDNALHIISKFWQINECSCETIVPIFKRLSYGNRIEQSIIGNSASGK